MTATLKQLFLSTQLNLAIQSIETTTKFYKFKPTTVNVNSLNRFIQIRFPMFSMIKILFVFHLYTKICFCNLTTLIFVFCAMVDYFCSFVLLIMLFDLVLLLCLFLRLLSHFVTEDRYSV